MGSEGSEKRDSQLSTATVVKFQSASTFIGCRPLHSTPVQICALALPLRRLDGVIGSRIDERARLHVVAGLHAELAAPVARGCEAGSATSRWRALRVGLLEDSALLPVARLPRLRPRGVHALRHAVATVPVARRVHAVIGAGATTPI